MKCQLQMYYCFPSLFQNIPSGYYSRRPNKLAGTCGNVTSISDVKRPARTRTRNVLLIKLVLITTRQQQQRCIRYTRAEPYACLSASYSKSTTDPLFSIFQHSFRRLTGGCRDAFHSKNNTAMEFNTSCLLLFGVWTGWQ